MKGGIMYNIDEGKKLVTEWGLSRDHFNNGRWGNNFGKFRLYRSLFGIWSKKVCHDGSVPCKTNDKTKFDIVNDDDRSYEEIALRYIYALYAQFPILRILGFKGLHKNVQDKLRNGIQLGIAFGLSNRIILDRLSTMTRTGTSLNIDAEAVGYIVPLEMFGSQGAQMIQNSGIMQYEIVKTKDELEVLTKQGNIIILGKFDETLIPDIDIKGGP